MWVEGWDVLSVRLGLWDEMLDIVEEVDGILFDTTSLGSKR